MIVAKRIIRTGLAVSHEPIHAAVPAIDRVRDLRDGEEPLDLSNPPTGYFSAVTPAPGPRPKFCSYCGSELNGSKCASCGAVNRVGQR